MKRAVGYARFSTDLQNEKSIPDQQALINRYAQLHEYALIKHYADAAQSGASILGREDLLELLDDARQGKFDVVIVEELDRLSRDMEDLAGIHKRLSFMGIEIIAIHEGVASTVTVGLRGLVGQLFREDNARKVRRGLQGKIRSGLSAGGKAYGYRPDPANKGKLLIVEEEAEIVRRIFQEFAEGKSPAKIAHALAAEKAPAPRANYWQASAIYGWAERGTGILRNHLYAGELVWNKIRMIKNPETGRRVSRANPPDQWERRPVPELQIVEKELFDRVQLMIAPKERDAAEKGRMKRPQRLLSGLLRCAACGSGMSVKGKDRSGKTRIECSRHSTSRTCPDPQTFYLEKVEEMTLARIRSELEKPETLVKFIEHYNEMRKKCAAQMLRRRSTLEKKINELDADQVRLVRMLAKGIGNEERIGQQMNEQEEELKALKAELALEPEPLTTVTLHPAALSSYKDALFDLQRLVNENMEVGRERLSKKIRELVDHIVVGRGKSRGEIEIAVYGKLRLLIMAPIAVKKVSGEAMVAEDGFEPPTQGL